jgi:cysteine synthase
MKRSRIFMAAGAFALAIAAVFATKANKKFAAVTTAHVADGVFSGISSGANLVTTTTNHHKAGLAIYTTGATVSGATKLGTLKTGSSGSTPVYLK